MLPVFLHPGCRICVIAENLFVFLIENDFKVTYTLFRWSTLDLLLTTKVTLQLHVNYLSESVDY